MDVVCKVVGGCTVGEGWSWLDSDEQIEFENNKVQKYNCDVSSEIKIRSLTIDKLSERHRNEPISNGGFEPHFKIKTVQCRLICQTRIFIYIWWG